MTEQLIAPTSAATLAPDAVRAFVAAVRERLVDLDPEELQELTMGLEADLNDLVSERGSDALGDPSAYARELRVAAGHSPEMTPVRPGRGVRQTAMDAIDSTHDSWDRLLDSLPGDVRGFLTSLQPVWWVLRAAIAWLVAQDVRAPYVVVDGPWLVVLAVFFVVSVQLGRGQWGLRGVLARSVLARLGLVALNVFAVTMSVGAADRLAWHVTEQRAWHFSGSYSGSYEPDSWRSIVYQGQQVCLLEVRDRAGERVQGGQVWDLTGDRPLPMRNNAC